MSAEEPPFKSKKFIAYLVAEMSWKILAVLVLFWGKDSIPTQVFIILLAIIVVAGFIESGYILGQASLDKYIRVAQIASRNGKSFNMKGLQVGHQPSATPSKPEPKGESTSEG